MRSMRTPDATHCIMLEVTSREGIQKQVYEQVVGKGRRDPLQRVRENDVPMGGLGVVP